MKARRILSLDGGGIRGLVTCRWLKGAEDALLDEEEAGSEDFGVVALVDVGGVLVVDVERAESGVEKGVETAEGGDAGFEGEAGGAGFAEELDHAGVGVFGTEVDDEGLVGRGEIMEDRFCFHIGRNDRGGGWTNTVAPL